MSILDATPASMIVNKGKTLPIKGHKNHTSSGTRNGNNFGRNEKLQTEYGSDMLKFVIIQSYINKLLGNSKVLHWFLENEVDYLNELKRISRINSLDDKTLTENSKS
ncbi:hypothetical protein BANRA_03647 [Escherichia coli]|nr:hypothetical protein BANRA_03647 [Escherichia coli]